VKKFEISTLHIKRGAIFRKWTFFGQDWQMFVKSTFLPKKVELATLQAVWFQLDFDERMNIYL